MSKKLANELLDPNRLGKRGEGWFIGQLVLGLLIIFPPNQFEVANKKLIKYIIIRGNVHSKHMSFLQQACQLPGHSLLVKDCLFARQVAPALYARVVVICSALCIIPGTADALVRHRSSRGIFIPGP